MNVYVCAEICECTHDKEPEKERKDKKKKKKTERGLAIGWRRRGLKPR